MTAFKAGLIQTNVSNDMAENVAFVREQARLARDAGADFIMTPENTGLIGANRADTLDKAQTEETHGMLAAARASARDTGAWFLLGSIHVRVPGEEQIRNRSYLIDSSGSIVASYDKIHMFDVELSGVGGQSYRESSTFKPGERSVLAETPWGVLGMTICYDLRFPELYRRLLDQGAEVLCVPAAFTLMTGKDHWEVLLRARAIENARQAVEESGVVLAGALQGLSELDAVLRLEMTAREIVGARERNERGLPPRKQRMDRVLQRGMQSPIGIEGQRGTRSFRRRRHRDVGSRLVIKTARMRNQQIRCVVTAAQKHKQKLRIGCRCCIQPSRRRQRSGSQCFKQIASFHLRNL